MEQQQIEFHIKYKSEVEMCKDVTKIISGILIPTKHRFIPEVPRNYGNDHSDMLFICNNGNMFIVEYKLKDLKGLVKQVDRQNPYCIGILNRKIKNNENMYRIFSFTGEDSEIERLAYVIDHRNFGRDMFYNNTLSVYWWGYRNSDSSFEGGYANCKRLSFYELYKQAIFNLQEEYKWNLDFYLVYNILGFYSKSVALKYYKQIMARANN